VSAIFVQKAKANVASRSDLKWNSIKPTLAVLFKGQLSVSGLFSIYSNNRDFLKFKIAFWYTWTHMVGGGPLLTNQGVKPVEELIIRVFHHAEHEYDAHCFSNSTQEKFFSSTPPPNAPRL
jgi:hypothetical protein